MSLTKNQLVGIVLLAAFALNFLPLHLKVLSDIAIVGAALYLIFIK